MAVGQTVPNRSEIKPPALLLGELRPKDHPGFSVCHLKAKALSFLGGSPTQVTSLQSPFRLCLLRRLNPKSYVFKLHSLIYTLPMSKTDDNKTTGKCGREHFPKTKEENKSRELCPASAFQEGTV